MPSDFHDPHSLIGVSPVVVWVGEGRLRRCRFARIYVAFEVGTTLRPSHLSFVKKNLHDHTSVTTVVMMYIHDRDLHDNEQHDRDRRHRPDHHHARP